MTITTDFTGTENYAERMAGLEAIHDWWFGTGAFAAAATLGQIRTNLNTVLVGTTILNREIFASWFAKVNTLNEPAEYITGLLFGDDEPGGLWQCTLPASLRAATDGTGEAAIGGSIARINDTSGNGLHLTQASTSLRPIRGRRPKTGARNILVPWNTFLTWSETAASFVPGVNARVVTANAAANPLDGAMNAVKIAASNTFSLQRLFTVSLGARTGDRLTLSCYLKAAGVTHVNLRTSLLNGVNFNLATGTATNLSGAGAESWGIEDLGDGWYRCHAVLITSGVEVAWLQLVNGVYTGSFAGNGTNGVFAYGYQAENADHVSPLQQVNGTLFNITEMGVGSASYADFDLVDDVLTSGAIAGGLTGQAFVAGDGGCFVSDLSVAAGGTFSIGGTSHNWTGAAPGILRAVTGGTGRVLDVMIREGNYTEDEIARLERYYRAQGGKGLLVPDGTELVTNGTFEVDAAGWSVTSNATVVVSSGQVTLSNDTPYSNATSAVLSQAVGTEAGGWYLMSLDIISRSPFGGFGAASGSSDTLRDLLDAAISTVGTKHGVFKAVGAVTYVKLFNGSLAAGASATFDNVSVKRLIPREDL